MRHGDGWALLDADGRVLAVTAAAPDLPGPARRARRRPRPGPRRRRPAALAVLGELPTALRSATEAHRRGADGLELVLDDGFRVVLGDGDDLVAKAEAATAVRQHAETAEGSAASTCASRPPRS